MSLLDDQVLAGSDNGLLRLFDISNALPKDADTPYGHDVLTFDRFEQLTSVHINSTDEQFLVSGYTKNVALYDIGTGRLLQLLNNLHQEPINVAKFAYHSPFMFATSSFDHDVKMWDLRQRMVRPCYSATSSRGNVMVCFSPDDQYLLVSAIDNEVASIASLSVGCWVCYLDWPASVIHKMPVSVLLIFFEVCMFLFVNCSYPSSKLIALSA